MSKNYVIPVFMVVTLVGLAFGQIPLLKSCPEDVTAMDNFEIEKYLGKWYEAERYLTVFEFGGKCVTAEYSLNEDGTVKVYNKQENKLSGEGTSIIGVARFNDTSSKKAELVVTFPSLPVRFDSKYWVLGTDYTSYAVVWACENLGPFLSANFAWILTRDRKPSLEAMTEAYAVVNREHIDRQYFLRTDQTNCPDDY